ncbi:hypothetical protein L5F46_10975 [Aliarcobacter butzleri]|uniref:hypothetical protein n=1 Tax=Aliarcobacter butzleri TaxID=28197 RepID=UPI001EDEA693|nr:hypothetical protein [Aliarcobacter butzleri]MCG3675294.1 hypothetical protein [Aliarcobacter butzleri]
MPNLKNKTTIILTILVVFIIYFFYVDNSTQSTKNENIIKVPIETFEKVEGVSKKNDVITNDTEKKQEDSKMIEEKGNVLFSSLDSSGRYTIQLINEVNIEIPQKNTTRYVPIIGELEENSTISDFTISVSENYLDYISDLKLKIIDNMDEKRVIETHTYFLGTLDLNSNYNIKLKISGDTLDGEIKSSSKLPDFMIEELSKDEPIIIDENEYNKSIMFQEQNNQ